MPLFDYRCWKCGLVFEALVNRLDEPVRCTACDHDLGPQDRMPSMPAAFPDADRWRNPAKGKNWKRVINDIRRKG